MRLLKFLGYYVLGMVGILLISPSPALFQNDSFFNIVGYTQALGELISKLFAPGEWVYYFKGQPEPLLTFLWEPYSYSMTIFLGAILLGFFIAFILALSTTFLPSWARKPLAKVLDIFEAIPDLLLAFSIQLFIVFIYKQTNVLVAQFTTLGQEKIYWLPIIALAVLPMISLYKVILMQIDEEMTKSYVSMAKSKGLEHYVILNVHVLRNITKSVFYHSKIIMWAALSSLLIIEYIFNINGITSAFQADFRPIVTLVILFMLFTPFFLFYQGVETFVFKERDVAEEANLRMNRFMGRPSFKPGGKWFKRTLKEVFAHFKNVKFLFGFVIIGGMLLTSIIYTWTAEPLVEQTFHVYDDHDRLVGAAPISHEHLFLGTNPLGYHVFDQLLVGAKYTIFFALIIALLRIVLGFILAVPFAFFLPSNIQRVVEKLVDSMHFLPLTVIALILLRPVLWMPQGGFETTETERIIYQLVVLTILVVPLVMTLLGNEMKLIMKEEFVMSTKILGGSSVHLLWRHLLPHLSARLGVLFGQQFIQTLLVFIHLGVFSLYFGGTDVDYSPMQSDPPQSTTYEWSGLIGAAKNSLMTGQWWLVVPALICFMILIVAMQFIIQGIKEVQQQRVGVPIEQNGWLKRLFNRKKTSEKAPEKQPAESDLVFMNSEHSRHG
ncbi:ABC transporter permease subunit [Thalassobacillus sp. CUG 92003]|uniref:ABC transporter permease subunit n=1 Tax=Thalassobacillus sp. CUG 92003 TaxID=2736641 RepID=UPI0015E62D48|nr:ABC transporter permease subunit [Thalassobacillus sp. CUG 92003]